MPAVLTRERIGAVQVLTLSRPEKRNAVSKTLFDALEAAFAAIAPDVRAVVLLGRGEHFCAGLDLAEQSARSSVEVLQTSRKWHRLLDAMQFSGKPVVAGLQGAVIGGGFEIAAAAHVRVAEPSAFFQLPEGRRGIYIGGGGSVRIRQAIGLSRMTAMLLTGQKLDAAAAERIGLVHELVAAGAARERAIELARHVAGNAPLVNYLVTNALPRIADMASGDGLFAESLAAAVSQTTDDAQRGMHAFLNRKAGKPGG